MKIRLLRADDDRTAFSSGNIELDRFFQRYAGQNQFRHHLGSTYVAIDVGELLGFVTVAPSEIAAEKLSAAKKKKLPAYPLPVLRLARLAVDRRAQKRGVGAELMRAVFALAHQLPEGFGCVGVLVDAKAEAIPFYEKLGFFALEVVAGELPERPAPIPMFLELGAIPKI